MKKLLYILSAALITGSSASSVVSCKVWHHDVLSKNLTEWNWQDILYHLSDVTQAIAQKPSDVYLNPDHNSPFIDEDGNDLSLQEMYKQSFPKNQSISDPSKSNGAGALQLQYVIDSYVVFYENYADDNGDSPLRTLEGFTNNFDVVYYNVSPNSENNGQVYLYDGKDNSNPLEKTKSNWNYNNTNSDNTNSAENLWSSDMTEGGYYATMKFDYISGDPNPSISAQFNFDVILKQNGIKEITSNGQTYSVPVSKDGYYVFDPENPEKNQYVSDLCIFNFSVPLI